MSFKDKLKSFEEKFVEDDELEENEPKPKKKREKGALKASVKASFHTRSFRVGGYSLAAIIFVVAIAVVINVIVGAIPSKYTQLDTTSSHLLSISEQTELMCGALDSEVDIYWVVRSGQEDSTLSLLLDRYEDLSDNIKITKKDPDVYPGFVKEYTDSYTDNSLIVVCGDRSRYVDNSEIYESDYSSYYTTGVVSTSFDGESAITSAIDYVTNEDLPIVYTLSGHGEASLSTTFQSAVEKENIDLESLSLLETGEIPEDADAILIYGLTSDISEQEKDVILEYLQAGGNVIVAVDPPQDGAYENLDAILEYYNVTLTDGIVIEGDQNYYAWSTPYYLLPDFGDHEITNPISENNYYVLLSIAQGMTVGDDLRDTETVTQLLTTSDAAFSKVAGYSMDTYEKEDGDIDGPFALAVAVTETLDDDTESNLVWVGSSSLLDDNLNEMVSGANQDLFLNTLNWMCDQDESSISIHAKSLSNEYLTINSGTASLLTILVVGIIPLCYLGIGIYVWFRRKRR